MEFATHVLLAYALARAFFSRYGWGVTLFIVLAGVASDLDHILSLFSPAAFLIFHRGVLHSILGALIIALVVAVIASTRLRGQPPFANLLLATGSAALLHLFLDVLQVPGAALLWPVRSARLSLDWLPLYDPWIIAILLAGILLPELLRLVSSEIGAKSKTPRGRNGAIAIFALLILYFAARGALHSSAIALMEPHTYHGESARRTAALPEALSLFEWTGVVETQSNLCILSVPVSSNRSFNPEHPYCVHKPEPSPELSAALKTAVARRLIPTLRFPRAQVTRVTDGSQVTISDFLALAESPSPRSVTAFIELDRAAQVTSERLMIISASYEVRVQTGER